MLQQGAYLGGDGHEVVEAVDADLEMQHQQTQLTQLLKVTGQGQQHPERQGQIGHG